MNHHPPYHSPEDDRNLQRIDRLVLRIHDLNKALRRYGRHDDTCSLGHPMYKHEGCSCGFDKVIHHSGK